MDIVGNDKADREAKKAVTHGSSPLHKLPAPLRKTLPWSKSAVRQEYHRKIKKAAMRFWSCSPRFDQMALIDPDFSHNKFAKLTRNISRNQASILFQLQSGHVPLNTYLHRINKTDSPICQGVNVTRSRSSTTSCDARPTWQRGKPCLTQPAGMQGSWENYYQQWS